MYITACGIRFNRKHGLATGLNIGIIKPATEKDIDCINKMEQKDKLLAFIRKVAWCNLTLESLETICDVVKKEIGNSAAKR